VEPISPYNKSQMLLNKYTNLKNLTAVLLLLIPLLLNSQLIYADDQVSARSMVLSSSASGGMSDYLAGFLLHNTTTPLAVIEIQFCANSPIIADPCDVPVGMDTTASILNNQIGNTGFILDNSVNGELVLTRNPSNPTSVNNYYQFAGIINPITNGEYFARIKTFPTDDLSAPDIEYGGVAMAITPNLTINAIVPPYITFCLAVTIPELNCNDTSGDNLDLGDFQTYSSNSGSYQFLVATNSGTGYSVSVYGTTLTSGNYIIPSLSQPSPPQYGVSQFGLNLVANTQPSVGADPIGDASGQPTSNYGITNQFSFNSGDIIASDSHNTLYTKFTNSVMVNISKSQQPGVYSTTLTYIATANF